MENIDFVSIYRKYRSRAFNIGKFILGDEDEAEDVCQDVFETLFHMGRSVDFSDEKKLENLIVRISYHKASDHRKKAFRKYEYANSDAILEMTDMRVRKGNRVDEIVLNLEAARLFGEHASFGGKQICSISIACCVSSGLIHLNSNLSILFVLILLSFSCYLVISCIFEIYKFPI